MSLAGLDPRISEFRRAVIEWYRKFGDRDLPWRQSTDPWAVLVAAVLLRKTTVSQVLKIYKAFLERFPTPFHLLDASISEIESVIKPLGIEHERAALLKKLAQEAVSKFEGKIPCDRSLLKSLPSVGDYAASEVLLVACRKPEPLLDRNMIRVLERALGVKSEKSRAHTDKKLWSFAKSLVPSDPELAKEFNFGILDLARKICTLKKPKCDQCPLNNICMYASINSNFKRQK